MSDTLKALDELERPAWGVWVDYKIAPPGSYACLVSRFMDNRWTDPEPQWMPAQLRPQLHGEVRVMPYLMPNDPLAAVNALPELLERVRRQRETIVDVMASLAAAISLLERGGKRGAPSQKMFDIMIADYKASLERARTALNQETGSFTDDPFNRAVLGLPLKETGQ